MSSLSSGYGLSSSLEEVMTNKKQGIVSILGSDCERAKTASLRRTLSADMSSKRWQAQHGFIPLKRIASSKELIQVSIADSPSSSEAEEEYEEKQEQRGQFVIWSSIQEEKKKENKEEEKQQLGQFHIWSSIISQKAGEDANNLPPPYVHPLVKRSASSLSEKSLEICTESLGSETGSDGFSSNPASEAGDLEEDKEEEQVLSEQEQELSEQEQEKVAEVTKPDVEDWRMAKYNLAAASRKSQPRSFPPPIPSLSSHDGASVHIRSRRNNGRLVLEVVSVASQNNFCAERQDGRLVLTFIDSPSEVKQARNGELNAEENDVDQFEVEIENYGVGMEQRRENGEEEQVEEMEEEEILEEKAPRLSNGVMGVPIALTMNKSMVLANKNLTWPRKFNEIVKLGKQEAEEEDEEMVVVERISPATLSLPPRHPVARMMTSPQAAAAAVTTKAVTSLNAYEYYWKPKPASEATKVSVYSPNGQKPLSYIESDNNSSSSSLILSKSYMGHERQEMMRGNKRDYLVPLPNGCKEPRRSCIFLEPHCIATS